MPGERRKIIPVDIADMIQLSGGKIPVEMCPFYSPIVPEGRCRLCKSSELEHIYGNKTYEQYCQYMEIIGLEE